MARARLGWLALAVPLAAAAQTTATGGHPFPVGTVNTVNVIEWGPNQLPKVYERSAQLPLTDAELQKLAAAGFAPEALVKMVEERRCACDASADGLIRLKAAGVPAAVVQAVSLHALPPNRALDLVVTIDLIGEGRTAREGYLYFFVDDGDYTRTFLVKLDDVLSRTFPHETMVDRTDFVIAKRVRRVELAGRVALKTYGKHSVLVAGSVSPTLTHPSQLSDRERDKAQRYDFDYPRSSLQSVCRLASGYRRDVVLQDKWLFVGSRFECEWN